MRRLRERAESLEHYPLLDFPLRTIRGYLSAPQACISIVDNYAARIDAAIGWFESPRDVSR